MKKPVLFYIVMFTLTTSFSKDANLDHFVGKWEVHINETPEGDACFILVLRRTKGELRGKIFRRDKTPIDIIEVEEDENSLDFFFNYNGLSINFLMLKVNRDLCAGKLMNKYKGICSRVQ